MQFSLSKMDEIFSFHSTGGKNKTFSDSLSGEPFYINQTMKAASSIPHVHAGGSITYTAPVTYSMHPVSYYLLAFVTEGLGSFHAASTDIPVSEGSVLLISSEEKLQFKTEKTPFSYQLYFLSGDCLPVYFKQLTSDMENALPFFYCKSNTNSYLAHTMKQLDHLLATGSKHTGFYIAKFLCDIFTELITLSSQEKEDFSSLPAHVYQMKLLFDEEYEKNHSLNDLEDSLKISKYRLCRDFSKYVGIPPLQYLNSVRMKHAKELLRDSTFTIHKVGSMVGIPNTNHFINLFHKDTGVTPLQYRQTKNRFPF